MRGQPWTRRERFDQWRADVLCKVLGHKEQQKMSGLICQRCRVGL